MTPQLCHTDVPLSLPLSMEDLALLALALQTHLHHQLPEEQDSEPRISLATALLQRVLEVPPGELTFTAAEALELAEALDSHLYWFVSDAAHRESGYVLWETSDDPVYRAECLHCETLAARFLQLADVRAVDPFHTREVRPLSLGGQLSCSACCGAVRAH